MYLSILFNPNQSPLSCSILVSVLADSSLPSLEQCTCSYHQRKDLGTSQQGAVCFSTKGMSRSSYHQPSCDTLSLGTHQAVLMQLLYLVLLTQGRWCGRFLLQPDAKLWKPPSLSTLRKTQNFMI